MPGELLKGLRDTMMIAVCAFVLVAGPVTCQNIDQIGDALRAMEGQSK